MGSKTNLLLQTFPKEDCKQFSEKNSRNVYINEVKSLD